LDGVACVAVRPSGSPDLNWEAIYLATFERKALDELQQSFWSDETDDILDALDRPEDASYDAGGRTHELQAIPLDDDPDLRAVIERMDDRAQESNEGDDLADQTVAEAFLRGSLEEHSCDEPLKPAQVASEPQVVFRRAAVLQRAGPGADPALDRELSPDEDPALQTDATTPSREARSLKPRLVRPQIVEPGSTEHDASAHHAEKAPDPAGERRTAKLRRRVDHD
jgi:hypothetical protein